MDAADLTTPAAPPHAAPPPFIGAEAVARALDYPSLIAALRRALLDPLTAPARMTVPLAEGPGQPAGTLLVMPAARPGGLIVVKLVTVHPALGARPGGALRSVLIALDAATGETRGVVDGHALTGRRTAAASALAATVLANPDARTLALVGCGAVALELAAAHAAVFGLERVLVWGRRADAAEAAAAELRRRGLPARATAELADAVASADIVSAATLSEAPLVTAAMVGPGAHVDLVGGFRPAMREADDALMARAALIVADGPAALEEAGDLRQPIAGGAITRDAVRLLPDLLRGPPARDPGGVTVFKSVGLALEDLAAAELLFHRLGPAPAELEETS